MTLSMNPLGFQLGVAGCVSPLVLVHRTINTCDPLLGTTKRVCHWRKAVFAFILAEFGLLPGLAAVAGEVNARHAAIAAKSNAARKRRGA
jgi:hypothetical protein